jgi:RNA polymerase sigma factor (sigma-70 family)
MRYTESTLWTSIRDAAAGSAEARDEFVRRYSPMVRAYLAARWRDSPELNELEDAVQDVFVDCFRQGGVLARAEPSRPGGFRAFLYGVARMVALRFEASGMQRRGRGAPSSFDLERVEDSEQQLSELFDRAWAEAILREAAARMGEQAQARGEAAVKRVDLLRLRFHDGLPIREIAKRWGVETATLHHEYARARAEFRAALGAVVSFHQPGTAGEIERECAELLQLLKPR